VATISNRDLGLTDEAWACTPLKTVVDVAKWNYYVAKTLRYLEEISLALP
jgi:hypothetical protein